MMGGRADSLGTRAQMTDRPLKRQTSKGNKPRAKANCGKGRSLVGKGRSPVGKERSSIGRGSPHGQRDTNNQQTAQAKEHKPMSKATEKGRFRPAWDCRCMRLEVEE